MRILREENVNNMRLVEGRGGAYRAGGGAAGLSGRLGAALGGGAAGGEGDRLGVVYVMDTGRFPFFLAEEYHQFHNGIGAAFPEDYRVGMKRAMKERGEIGATGCPELPF